MVLKKRTKKLLIIALVAVTVVWPIALYLHIQAYNRYKQDMIERWIARSLDEDFVRGYVGFQPVVVWGFGGYLVISAFIILFAWVRVIILAFRYMLRSPKQNNV